MGVVEPARPLLVEVRAACAVAWLGVFLLRDGLKASNYMFFAILLSPLLILAIRVLATGGWLSRGARIAASTE